jgi:hypothetical protein
LTVTHHFGYAIDHRYLPLLLPFGLRRKRDGVTLAEGSMLATDLDGLARARGARPS